MRNREGGCKRGHQEGPKDPERGPWGLRDGITHFTPPGRAVLVESVLKMSSENSVKQLLYQEQKG